jgi:PAS domain S-box-containing protein
MGRFRDFLVGSKLITSRTEFKYAMLRAQFAGIMGAVALFYVALDGFNGVQTFIPFYGLLAAGGVLSFILNRKGWYTFATVIQLITINLLIFIFADVDNPFGGVYFYFMTCSIVALILLNYYNRVLSLLFAFIPVVLGFIAYSWDFNLLPQPSYEPYMIKVNFLSNLAIGIASNVFVVYFLINRNRETEQNLIRTSTNLSASEERFSMALRGTRAGIYEWRVKENTAYVSPYWKNLLGYEEDELKNVSMETFMSFIHPDDLGRTSQSVEIHLSDHKPYQNELRLRIKSGKYKWFLDSGVSKLDQSGNAIVVIGSIIDIDERKKAEEELAFKNLQLAKTNEELDRFVYSASHDMRAPLSSLLGLIHLSEKTDQPEEVGLFLQMMKDRIKTMEGFIKEVTDYSRNTRLDLLPAPVKLEALAREVVQTLAYSVVNKKVRIEVQIDTALEISTDPNRLKVIINNLVSNAYKYHRFDQPDPFIIISASAKGNHVLLTVKDNGIGIAPEHHTRIFDMFYRASESSEGSGLGLYIVKETLDKLEGSISVLSTAGEGSEFTVTLPISL